MGLTVLIILFGVGALVFYLAKKSMNKKFTRLVFIGYIAVLCLSFGIYEFGISKKITVFQLNKVNNVEKELQTFYDSLYEGKIEEIDQSYVYEEMEVDYKSNKLFMKTNQIENGIGFPIIVDRKTSNDHKIEITYYRTQPATDKPNIMKDVKPLQWSWEDETLTLNIPKEMEFNVATIKKEFPIVQFYGDYRRIEVNPTAIIGEEALYLLVPKDLEIVAGAEIYIDYVGEEE